MKALKAEGLGFDRIAERLNAEGVPTRTGRHWHGVVVNRILTDKTGAEYVNERPHPQPTILRVTSPRCSSSATNKDGCCCTRVCATPNSRLISSTMASVLRPFTIPCQTREPVRLHRNIRPSGYEGARGHPHRPMSGLQPRRSNGGTQSLVRACRHSCVSGSAASGG